MTPTIGGEPRIAVGSIFRESNILAAARGSPAEDPAAHVPADLAVANVRDIEVADQFAPFPTIEADPVPEHGAAPVEGWSPGSRATRAHTWCGDTSDPPVDCRSPGLLHGRSGRRAEPSPRGKEKVVKHHQVSRRLFVIASAVVGGQALMAACGGTAPPAPTAAPAKPTEAPKPAGAAPTAAAAPTQAATAAAATAAPTTAPAAQAKPAAGGAKVELNVAHTWPAERWPEQVEFDKKFMEKNPNITIKATNTEFNEYFRKILAQAASNTLPDVMYMQDTRVSQWMRQGSFRSLDQYVKADKDFKIEEFAPEALKLTSYKGQLYAIPYDWGGPCLVYNKTIFDEAKIKYPDESWTLDSLLDAAKATTLPGKQWGWDYAYIGNWAMESMYFRPFGADVFNADETASALTTEPAIQAMTWWSDLLLKHKVAPTPAEKQAVQTVPFAVGRVAMYYAPPWNTPTFNKFGGDKLKWDIAPMPKGPKERTSAAMGSNFAMSKDSKTPDAAWTYLSQYLSKDGMEFMWTCRGVGLMTRPSANGCFLSSPGLPPGGKYWVDGISYMKMGRPVQPAADEVIRIMTREYDNLFLGKATVKETHETITKQIDPLLAKNKE